jgi:hypothetical protein
MGGRRIAIIGSGQAGLLAAHGLARAKHEVTLYSDRSADKWLDSRPTGTAGRFAPALAFEKELGLNHWDEAAPKMQGVHLTFSPVVGNRLATLTGRAPEGSLNMAVDLRLQSHRWMNDLPSVGGRVVVESVTVDRLDEIAAQNELTIVATGRGPLAELFPRNAERSVYDKPQRKLAMVIAKGAPLAIEGVPFFCAKFNLFADAGEAFWIPYFLKDETPCWCLLFEAKAGGRMDRFDDCKSHDAVMARAKEVIADMIPWDKAWADQLEACDPLGWLVGGVPPTVRAPVGRLPSGRVVMPLGDTAVSMDPIGGQGANLGNKYARCIVETIAARPDATFDATWMETMFEAFWADHGARTVQFNNILLEPMTAAGKLLLIAQYGTNGIGDSPKQRIADAIVENFMDPRKYTEAFVDKRVARELIAKATGGGWRSAFLGGALRIGGKQLGRVFGIAPKHPIGPTAAA